MYIKNYMKILYQLHFDNFSMPLLNTFRNDKDSDVMFIFAFSFIRADFTDLLFIALSELKTILDESQLMMRLVRLK